MGRKGGDKEGHRGPDEGMGKIRGKPSQGCLREHGVTRSGPSADQETGQVQQGLLARVRGWVARLRGDGHEGAGVSGWERT